jgi:hypothetical protein
LLRFLSGAAAASMLSSDGMVTVCRCSWGVVLWEEER